MTPYPARSIAAATSRVADEWVKDLNAKGFNGKQLLTEAKAACK
jgi:hypothetical protein